MSLRPPLPIEDRVITPTARDGSTWAPMRVWEHRRSAMMCLHDSMRGLPDDADITEAPAWLRSRECRRRRLMLPTDTASQPVNQ